MPENLGLYQAYWVTRKSGREKEGATYFVLDVVNDPHAQAALRTYRVSCEGTLPELARALVLLDDELQSGRRDGPALQSLRTPLPENVLVSVEYEFELTAKCPVDGSTDHYVVTVKSRRTIPAEKLLAAAKEATEGQPVFQEVITERLARSLGERVETVGVHSGVKTKATARGAWAP